jgi:hypothetical protein
MFVTNKIWSTGEYLADDSHNDTNRVIGRTRGCLCSTRDEAHNSSFFGETVGFTRPK